MHGTISRRPIGGLCLNEHCARCSQISCHYPGRFRLALLGGMAARRLARLFPGRLRTVIEMAPAHMPKPSRLPNGPVFPATGQRSGRVALLAGCVQQVLAPPINDATIRLLNRQGVEVVVPPGAGCCGALVQHLGLTPRAGDQAATNVDAWMRELDGNGLDAVIINASGCGTTVKDYGHMLRETEHAGRAARIADMTRDVTEFLSDLGLPETSAPAPLRVAYHSACSMQHGQGIRAQPVSLLRRVGFEVVEPSEAHLCCGSAGTYNLLQPKLATRLRDRKVANLSTLHADVIATGNIGCMIQIATGIETPTVHTVELLDWATGGPRPAALA